MSETKREQVKVFDLGDETVRAIISETFTADYRHGYYLREIVRSASGGWLCVWARAIDSYAPDFDWPTQAEGGTDAG